MKIPALLTVLALACGSSFAGGSYSGSADRDAAGHPKQSATVASDTKANDGIVDKTKRAFRRMGDKMRSASNRADHDRRSDQAMRSDTRSMGAAGSETQDSARQRRMDEAYDNWKAKQK
jgi:hypothetical protein